MCSVKGYDSERCQQHYFTFPICPLFAQTVCVKAVSLTLIQTIHLSLCIDYRCDNKMLSGYFLWENIDRSYVKLYSFTNACKARTSCLKIHWISLSRTSAQCFSALPDSMHNTTPWSWWKMRHWLYRGD